MYQEKADRIGLSHLSQWLLIPLVLSQVLVIFAIPSSLLAPARANFAALGISATTVTVFIGVFTLLNTLVMGWLTAVIYQLMIKLLMPSLNLTVGLSFYWVMIGLLARLLCQLGVNWLVGADMILNRGFQLVMIVVQATIYSYAIARISRTKVYLIVILWTMLITLNSLFSLVLIFSL